MTLHVLQSAPDFLASAVISDEDNEAEPIFRDIHLLGSFPNKWIILVFHPLAFTYVSPTEIKALSDLNDHFQTLNTQILAISCDSKFSQLSWAKRLGSQVKIPLVSDFSKEIASAYGVLTDDGMPLRATFIISPSGVVRHSSVNDLPIGRNTFETLRLLMALQYSDANRQDCVADWIPGDTFAVDTSQMNSYFSRMKPKQVSRSPLALIHSSISNLLSQSVSSYQQFLRTKPLLAKAITSGLISVLGEILSSFLKHSHDKNANRKTLLTYLRSIDIKRIIIFGAYGTVVTGPVFHYWYGFLNQFVGKMKLSLPTSIALQLGLNQLVLSPSFLLVTLAYLNYFQSFDASKTARALKNTFAAALYTNWKIWTPAQAINFSFVPLDYRVVYGNVVALWWNLYLSYVS